MVVNKKPKIIPLPLETEKATVVVDAEVPAVLLDNPNVPATTTKQEDIASQDERDTLQQMREGQRKINLTWELTQAFTTSAITLAAIYCAINRIESDILNFAFVAIISTYYARTNHTKVGGVGYKTAGETR